jgi:hypothetical protein
MILRGSTPTLRLQLATQHGKSRKAGDFHIPLLGKTTGVQPGEYFFVVVGVGFAQIWRGIRWKSSSMIGLVGRASDHPSEEQFI